MAGKSGTEMQNSQNNKKKSEKKIYHYFKAFWKFIWEEDSLLSWLVNVVLAFVLIKFIVYPALGFILGTGYPIVAVVSGSMEHKIVEDSNNRYSICDSNYFTQPDTLNYDEYWAVCGSWYEKINISKEKFASFRFRNGFNTGDIMILIGEKPKDIEVGEVIVFWGTGRPDPIIHRVVAVNSINGKYYYQTKGDHNQDSFAGIGETSISEDRVLGKALIRVPYLGWVKILFVRGIQYIIGIF